MNNIKIVIKKLVWDDWNIAHIARHNVKSEEVEDICKPSSQTEGAKKGRLRITGLTQNGRLISAFLDPEPQEGIYYPVSASDASRKERKDYDEWLKGGEKTI